MLMISVNEVMKILKDYLICDNLYKEIDKIEIICKLNQAAVDTEIIVNSKKVFVEEEWFE